jgi:hypothetical protein
LKKLSGEGYFGGRGLTLYTQIHLKMACNVAFGGGPDFIGGFGSLETAGSFRHKFRTCANAWCLNLRQQTLVLTLALTTTLAFAQRQLAQELARSASLVTETAASLRLARTALK